MAQSQVVLLSDLHTIGEQLNEPSDVYNSVFAPLSRYIAYFALHTSRNAVEKVYNDTTLEGPGHKLLNDAVKEMGLCKKECKYEKSFDKADPCNQPVVFYIVTTRRGGKIIVFGMHEEHMRSDIQEKMVNDKKNKLICRMIQNYAWHRCNILCDKCIFPSHALAPTFSNSESALTQVLFICKECIAQRTDPVFNKRTEVWMVARVHFLTRLLQHLAHTLMEYTVTNGNILFVLGCSVALKT